MYFVVSKSWDDLKTKQFPTYPAVFLYDNGWDDYGYKTLFNAFIYLKANGVPVDIGEVKIVNVESEERRTVLPDTFERLPEGFYSLGQSVEYYKGIGMVGDDARNEYLSAMSDIVYNKELLKAVEGRDVFVTSMLRFSDASKALKEGAYYMGLDGKRENVIRFVFKTKLLGADTHHVVDFDFSKYRELPNRVNVVVGTNGTGKTQTLANLALALSGVKNDVGEFVPSKPPINKVLALSYNAFDEFDTPESFLEEGNEWTLFSYKYCGLRYKNNILQKEDLYHKVEESLVWIDENGRIDLVRKYLRHIIRDQQYLELFIENDGKRREIYYSMSAGQRLMTSILFDVTGFIQNESLMLFDEPETHLHPGLLSTLVILLNEILEDFESYAIVSSHSPIILQQVPSRYVKVFKRYMNTPEVTPLSDECFGETLTNITEKVLGLAEPEYDYRNVLMKLSSDYAMEEVLEMFDGKLCLNAKIFLTSIYNRK